MLFTHEIIIGITILANTVTALPMAGPYRIANLPIPSNNTELKEWPKFTSHSSFNPVEQSSESDRTVGDQIQGPECPELCALMAQPCVVALPHDEGFCWATYHECSDRCETGV